MPIFILLFTLLTSNSYAADKKKAAPKKAAAAPAKSSPCPTAKIEEFKKLYFELQEKLNYSGTDEKYDPKKKKLIISKHNESEEYNGKVFESALYTEFQNTLVKVARIYQNRKNLPQDTDPRIPAFFNSLEEKDFKTNIPLDQIENFIDNIVKTSQSSETEYKLTDNDRYLLKHLLIHAQDRICTLKIAATANDETQYLKDARSAPLSRLFYALKNGGTEPNKDLAALLKTHQGEIDEKKAVTLAVQAQLKKLKDWISENQGCIAKLKNPSFLNNNIQACNYGKFLNSLNEKDATWIESVLHFINANQSSGKKKTTADTNLNTNTLVSYMDKAFNQGVRCNVHNGQIFITGLDVDSNGIPKFNKLTCTNETKAVECKKTLKFEVDNEGRGFKISQINKKDNIAFTYNGEQSCTQNLKKPEPKAATPQPTPATLPPVKIEDSKVPAPAPVAATTPSDSKVCIPNDTQKDAEKHTEKCCDETNYEFHDNKCQKKLKCIDDNTNFDPKVHKSDCCTPGKKLDSDSNICMSEEEKCILKNHDSDKHFEFKDGRCKEVKDEEPKAEREVDLNLDNSAKPMPTYQMIPNPGNESFWLGGGQ